MLATVDTSKQTKLNIRAKELFRVSDVYFAIPLLAKHVLDECNCHHAPISLRQILSKFEVPIDYIEGDDWKKSDHPIAELAILDNNIRLKINRSTFRHSHRRARFSIAHEIAHLTLIKVFGSEIIDWAHEDKHSYDQIERICDHLAANILIPQKLLRDHVRQFGFNTLGINAALKKFAVSKTALFFAIANMVPGSAVVNIDKFKRHANEDRVWRVKICAANTSRKNIEPWLPVGCTAKKHLDFGLNLDELEIDHPKILSPVKWSLGSNAISFDGIICKLGAVDMKAIDQRILETAITNMPEYTRGSVTGILALIGPHNRIDSNLFIKKDL